MGEDAVYEDSGDLPFASVYLKKLFLRCFTLNDAFNTCMYVCLFV